MKCLIVAFILDPGGVHVALLMLVFLMKERRADKTRGASTKVIWQSLIESQWPKTNKQKNNNNWLSGLKKESKVQSNTLHLLLSWNLTASCTVDIIIIFKYQNLQV